MGDEADTHLRRRSTNFKKRLSSTLLEDIRRENIDSDEEEEDRLNSDGDNENNLPVDDASDIETEEIIEPNELFDSDEEIEEEGRDAANAGQQQNNADEGFFYGKDGTEWSKEEPVACIRQHNIMKFRAGPKQPNSIPIEVFKKFFSSNISFVIITETNRYAKGVFEKWNNEHPDSKPKVWVNLTSTELDAFIGIMLAAGVTHNNMLNTSLLWRCDNLPIFRATMSYYRFKTLTQYIRFDNGRGREYRQRTDKAAPIRDIWNFLNENLEKHYNAHETVVVDDQLFPYRGRTKFTHYNPSKPAKYGIKVWWAYDSTTKYPLQGKLYTGTAEGEEREVNQGENVLLQFANRYVNSGRTLVADNFFITLDAAKRLAAIGLAVVGPIRSNQKCIPPEMKKSGSRPVLSTLFGFHENRVSICSYVPKKNIVVNLLSTVHFSKNVQGEAKKPEAILFYKANKGEGDCMDKMLSQFTTKRPTKRWTFAFFCNMLDVMAFAAFCICKEIDGPRRGDARRNFLTTLSNTLVRANIENRMNNPNVIGHFSTRVAMESFFGTKLNNSSENVVKQRSGPDTLASKKNCLLCYQDSAKLRRKTRFFCAKCSNAVCQQHSKIFYECFSCGSQNP